MTTPNFKFTEDDLNQGVRDAIARRRNRRAVQVRREELELEKPGGSLLDKLRKNILDLPRG